MNIRLLGKYRIFLILTENYRDWFSGCFALFHAPSQRFGQPCSVYYQGGCGCLKGERNKNVTPHNITKNIEKITIVISATVTV